MTSRREFTKALYGLSASLFGMRLLADDSIGTPTFSHSMNSSPQSPLSTQNLTVPANSPLIWIDGVHFDLVPTVQANVSILIKEKQSKDSYVISAYLVQIDSSKNVSSLGFRLFGPDDKLRDGFPPYLIFNGVDLSSPQGFPYQFGLYYAVRTPEADIVYSKKFSSSEMFRSRLDSIALLGVDMRKDAARFSQPDGGNGGIINSIYYRSQVIGNELVATHQLDAKLIELNGDFFTVRAKILHPTTISSSPKHYTKYYLVTDPVGRLLGFQQKDYSQYDLCDKTNPDGCVDIKPLTDAQRNQLGILPENCGKISDCPYIMVFADDLYAVAKTIIYL